MSSEATQTVSVYDVLAWLETNKKSLIIAFVAAVAIGFGVAIFRYNADQKELTASDALLKLKAAIASNENTAPPQPSAFLKIAEQYPGTAAADRALLLAGASFFTEGKYVEASNQFSKFVRDNPQSPFAATAALGVAACLEAQGKRDEALAAYQNLSVRYPNSSVLDQAKLATARIDEAKNQPDLALRIYDELMKPEAMSAAGSEAMTRRQDLLARHPELAKTNAPAVSLPVVKPIMTNAPSATTTNPAPAKP